MLELFEEAQWAYKKAVADQLLTPLDTAVIGYSWDHLERYLSHLRRAFQHPDANYAIAIKTQPHPCALRKIIASGMGLEAASYEELLLAQHAGIAPEKLVFDSPIKTVDEILLCNSHFKKMLLNVNSIEELQRLPSNIELTVGIRINPTVDTGTPSIFNVSRDDSKFGVPIVHKKALIDVIQQYPIEALHVHSGSHMQDLTSAVKAIRLVVDLANAMNIELQRKNIDRRIKVIDIGGGLPPELLGSPDSPNSNESTMQQYAILLKKNIPELWEKYTLVTEFGQWVHYYTGYVISDVEYILKQGNYEQEIVYLHVGGNLFVRDIYGHSRNMQIRVIDAQGNEKKGRVKKYDLAGPLCFAQDYLGKGVELPKISKGDKVVLLGVGSNAYGLWSRHCTRTVPKTLGGYKSKDRLSLLTERWNPYIEQSLQINQDYAVQNI